MLYHADHSGPLQRKSPDLRAMHSRGFFVDFE